MLDGAHRRDPDGLARGLPGSGGVRRERTVFSIEIRSGLSVAGRLGGFCDVRLG